MHKLGMFVKDTDEPIFEEQSDDVSDDESRLQWNWSRSSAGTKSVGKMEISGLFRNRRECSKKIAVLNHGIIRMKTFSIIFTLLSHKCKTL